MTQGNNAEPRQKNDKPIIVHASMLVHGDSSKLLAEIDDASIDCIITDPPYFIDGMGNEWSDAVLRKSRVSCEVRML